MSTPYKKNAASDVISQLKARSSNWKNQGKYPGGGTGTPAYCKISSGGLTLPVDDMTFNAMYQQKFKPGASLESVNIRLGGNYGLTLEVEFTFICNTLEEYERFEKQFCVFGNTFDVEYGYAGTHAKGYTQTKKIKGFVTCSFSMGTTQEGGYNVKVIGIAPAASLNTLTVQMGIDSKGRKFKSGRQTHSVTSMIELLAYHAQRNGNQSIDSATDGEVVKTPLDGAPLVIYASNHFKGFFTRFSDNIFSNEVSKNSKVVYVSLEWIVNCLNTEIFPEYAKIANAQDASKLNKYKIKFDKDLSVSYIDENCRSANPLSMLILGNDLGKYKSGSSGKDFESTTAPGEIQAVNRKVNNRHEIDIKKILIERSVLIDALSFQWEKPKAGEKTEVKQEEEGGTKIDEFFGKLFNVIKEETGGAIQLRLGMHPDALNDEKKMGELYIFDENNGYFSNKIQCAVFDPIQGDGTTRVCNITADVGSKEYQGQAFASAKTKNAVKNEADGKPNDEVKQEDTYTETVKKITELVNKTIPESDFDEQHLISLRDLQGTLRQTNPKKKELDFLVYAGLGIDIELDGIDGFFVGNAIMTTQLSKRYRDAKTYFSVISVEHTFTGQSSEWTTKIQGPLSFHYDVEYVNL
jgi:hypothetical protein